MALVVTGAAAGVAVFVLPGDGGSRSDVVVGATQADDVLPSVTSSDWVTYTDQVVVVRPTAEQEIPASPEETEAGEGYIGRSATLTVDTVLWTRPGAPAAPATSTVTGRDRPPRPRLPALVGETDPGTAEGVGLSVVCFELGRQRLLGGRPRRQERQIV